MPKERKKSETDIERTVCAYAMNKYGMLTFKWSSPQRRGVPDRIFITREGLIAFIEFKKEGDRERFLRSPKTQTEHLQHRTMQQLQVYDCEVFVIDSLEKGLVLVDLISNAEEYIRVTREREKDIIVPSFVSSARH